MEAKIVKVKNLTEHGIGDSSINEENINVLEKMSHAEIKAAREKLLQ